MTTTLGLLRHGTVLHVHFISCLLPIVSLRVINVNGSVSDAYLIEIVTPFSVVFCHVDTLSILPAFDIGWQLMYHTAVA